MLQFFDDIGLYLLTSGVIDISDIIQPFEHDKSSSISQLINSTSRYLQTLLKYFYGTKTSVFNVLLSFGVLAINFVLYSKDLLVIVSLLFIVLLALWFSFSSSFTSSL